MATNIKAILKLQIPAAEATPGPPLGPTLGQHGINIQEFIKKFNDKTANQKGAVLPIQLIIYQDRSFDFQIKQPLTAYLLKKAANVAKGSDKPKLKKVGSVSRQQLEEITKTKMADLNTTDFNQALKIVEGTARSLGIEIK